jgi:hypothetical protein
MILTVGLIALTLINLNERMLNLNQGAVKINL